MKSTILSLFMIVLIIAMPLSMSYVIYQRNKLNLNIYKGSRQIRPNKTRYIFSWFIYSLFACLTAIALYVPLAWLIYKRISIELMWMAPSVWLAMLLFLTPSMYPYFTIAIFNNVISGATLWGGKRTEINLAEIDKNKILRQKIGRIFGVTVIYSTGKVKILSLGLDDIQLSEILELVDKNG